MILRIRYKNVIHHVWASITKKKKPLQEGTEHEEASLLFEWEKLLRKSLHDDEADAKVDVLIAS